MTISTSTQLTIVGTWALANITGLTVGIGEYIANGGAKDSTPHAAEQHADAVPSTEALSATLVKANLYEPQKNTL